jgi:hypothetical protein
MAQLQHRRPTPHRPVPIKARAAKIERDRHLIMIATVSSLLLMAAVVMHGLLQSAL